MWAVTPGVPKPFWGQQEHNHFHNKTEMLLAFVDTCADGAEAVLGTQPSLSRPRRWAWAQERKPVPLRNVLDEAADINSITSQLLSIRFKLFCDKKGSTRKALRGAYESKAVALRRNTCAVVGGTGCTHHFPGTLLLLERTIHSL